MSSDSSAWMARWGGGGERALRLVCIPHAGGGASSFRDWAELLPDRVELCAIRPPGIESRLGETPVDEMCALVTALSKELASELIGPYVLFGQCSGALVAFELVRRLRALRRDLPLCLFGSACPAPQQPRAEARLHDLPFDRLIDALSAFGGIDTAVLTDLDLLELLEPKLRADLRMIETWRYQAQPALSVPISIIGGTEDQFVNPDELLAWREQTTTRFSLRLLEGGHFVALSHTTQVIRAILDDIAT